MSQVKLPRVGGTVHYVSHGTPFQADGSQAYTSRCRAAIVTEQTSDPDHPSQVGLVVLNPTGTFFHRAVPFHDGSAQNGTEDCPTAEAHGSPFRYCACGWVEPSFMAGSWHPLEACDA
ncbi:hypothetical protein ACFY30_22310 [Streptomyces sp. NPDC000345]|uniref:hypothetical protein n=1 Tax=Streptomyces sp. NPDC000345 TaxID=3364537 RepID=UPI0036B2F969